jgi:hypothetical protein
VPPAGGIPRDARLATAKQSTGATGRACSQRYRGGSHRLEFSPPGVRALAADELAWGDGGIIDRSLRTSAMLMAMRIRNTAMTAAISAIIMSITMSDILI